MRGSSGDITSIKTIFVLLERYQCVEYDIFLHRNIVPK
jgi:hypothetical protein